MTAPDGSAAGPAATASARGRAMRSDDDRLIAGVCGGLARWLNVDPAVMRLVFAWGSAIGGAGLLAYAALAVALPADEAAQPARKRPLLRRVAIRTGFALQFAGVATLLYAIGLAPQTGIVIVATLAAIGCALLWRAASGAMQDRDSPRSSVAAAARVFAGLALLGAGAALSLRPDGIGSVGLALVVAAAVAGGAALLFGPSLRRARREAQTERLERIRANERAAVAARLHDSVLQTFAVIQRLDDASPRVQGLARTQERELRAWLYGGEQPDGPATMASALRHATEEVELMAGVAVDLVQPADAPIDDDVLALVQAAREAMLNAARHAGVKEVSVLARVTPDALEVYVRDRGTGFDLGAVGEDRRGVRDSIVGRMQRHGGTAIVTSALGEGTEVELRLPRHTPGSEPA
ncbi:MAG: PspC domain-containing protein [Solirubrobacteraceae bacterium]|nr:PspC domain-containing protein [Solirubrobacteraceae bacterium]